MTSPQNSISHSGFKSTTLLLFLFAAASVAAMLFYFRNTPLLVDENDNYNQILNFTRFDFRLLEISALPGYHSVIAACALISNTTAVIGIRAISSLFALLSVWAFFRLTSGIDPANRNIKTIQYFLFPILFIFFVLIYTDVMSLLMVMTTLVLAQDRKYFLAGIFAILSMLIRQNNVIWNLFILAVVYVEENGWKFDVQQLRATAAKWWMFIAGFLLFTLFVILNRGVAVGDAAHHPAFKLSSGNIVYILFCWFILFIPLHLSNLAKVTRQFVSTRWAIPSALGVMAFFWLTFSSDHPYNSIEPHYYFRNLLFTKISSSEILKLVLFLPALYAVFSLTVTPLIKRSHYLLYPFTLLFLAPSWLIEQRYYLIPFVLFLVFKKTGPRWVEIATIAWFLIFLIFLLPLVVSVKLFP